MKIKYYGQSAILLEKDGKSVIVDPFLSNNPIYKSSPNGVKTNAIIVTHGHPDHVGDSIIIAKNNNCPIIAAKELIDLFLQKDSTLKTASIEIGESKTFDFGNVRFTYALHPNDADVYGITGEAPPVGVIINISDFVFYHAGDTRFFDEMKDISNYNIDLAALPIGGHYTMGIDESIEVAKMIKAKLYMPMHYNTFDLIKVDINEWYRKMKENNLETLKIGIGDSVTI